VQARDGSPLADNWTQLFAAPNTLAAVTGWACVWSGSDASGNYWWHDCEDWSTAAGLSKGRVGRPSMSGALALSEGWAYCADDCALLCACDAAATGSPTADGGATYVYGIGDPGDVGSLGDRAAADAVCRTAFEYAPYEDGGSSYTFENCAAYGALVCFPGGDDVRPRLRRD